MPLYKLGTDRFKKYSAKYVPDTVGARFGQVESIAKERAQEGLIKWSSAQDLVRPILEKYGITGPDRAKYLGFANKLLKHMLRHAGDSATAIAEGLKSYWVTAYKGDPAVLDEIIQVIVGWVVPY